MPCHFPKCSIIRRASLHTPFSHSTLPNLNDILVRRNILRLNLTLAVLLIMDGDSLLSKTHLSREGRVRNPATRLSWRNLLQHTVNLLERQALGLRNKEVCEEDGDNAEGAPHEEDLGGEVGVLLVDEVWGDDGDDAVPEPVGGGGKSNTTRADWQREDLTDNNLRAGTPGGGEHADVDADEGNHG